MDGTILNNLPLFRPEVVADKQSSHLGQVLIHQPSSYRLITLSALLLVLLVLAFLLLGTYTRKATAPGLLIPDDGVLRILTPTEGRVLEVKVKEGDSVKAGDPLFLVSDEHISILGDLQELKAKQLLQRTFLIEKSRGQAEARLAHQSELLKMRLHALDIEKSEAHVEISLLEQREKLAKANLERQQQLLKRGYISTSELQQAETEQLELASQFQSVKRSQTSLEHDRLTLMMQRRDQEAQYQRDIADAELSLALLQQEIAENSLRTQQLIQAPFDGRLTGLNVQPGQQIAVNTLMASLIPLKSQLHAHLYITPRQAGFIRPDQHVFLRYEAYPYQKFGMAQGRVIDITNSPYSVHELQPHIASTLQGGHAAGAGENFYRVTVELESQHAQVYGRKQLLLPGMQLEADISQEKRKIYEWILEPIYSMTRKI